jgi:RNA polymerase sigma-70 factor (ECF subfamily)
MVNRGNGAHCGALQADWTLRVARNERMSARRRGTEIHELARTECSSETPDRELVDACLAGDRDAFDRLVERHRKDVYQICYRFMSNHEDASDLSQDVFVRAYRGLKTFKGQASFRTWLYRISVNVCLNRVSLRTASTQPLEAEHLQDWRAIDPDQALLRGERAARVRQAIALLPRKQRATLLLRVYQELSHDEIARILGGSVGAVKANLFHAIANLRRMLSRETL